MEYAPSGRLALSITNERLRGARTLWQDGKRQRLEDCLGDFIAELPVAAQAISEERKAEFVEPKLRPQDIRTLRGLSDQIMASAAANLSLPKRPPDLNSRRETTFSKSPPASAGSDDISTRDAGLGETPASCATPWIEAPC